MHAQSRKRLLSGHSELGLTLIELMVSLLIAMIIMAGLFLSFSQQSTEYNYQNRRVDAVQDLEFSIQFIANDLEASLMTSPVGTVNPNPAENANFAGVAATSSLTFWVWDTVNGVVNSQAQRKYALIGNSLRYDSEASVLDNTGNANQEILPNVTFFKVFKDDIVRPAGFLNMPNPLANSLINNSAGNAVSVPGYTILVEIAVQAGYKQGVFQDVQGNPTTNKRIWRYVQVHPATVVN